MEGRLDFTKRGIIEYNPNPKFDKKRLDLFESLATEARTRVANEQVTLKWWNNWNQQLHNIISHPSAVVTDSNLETTLDIKGFVNNSNSRIELGGISPKRIEEGGIPFYTTIDLGIIDINRMHAEDIAPLGLVSRDIKADGVLYSPEGFLEHDIAHFRTRSWREKKYSQTRFHQEFEDIVKDFPPRKRKMAEIGRFLLTQEQRPETYPKTAFSTWNLERHGGLTGRFFNNEDDMGGLIPENIRTSKKSVEDYLDHAENVFNSIYR